MKGETAKIVQIVYVIVAIAAFYYPDPDVATSNGLQELAEKNVTIPAELYQQLLALQLA